MARTCSEGVKIPFDGPCSVCGATDNDTCGRWAHRMSEVETALRERFPQLPDPVTAEAVRSL